MCFSTTEDDCSAGRNVLEINRKIYPRLFSSMFTLLGIPFYAVNTNFGASGMPRHVHIPPKIRVLNHNSVKNGQIELKLSSNVHYTILK